MSALTELPEKQVKVADEEYIAALVGRGDRSFVNPKAFTGAMDLKKSTIGSVSTWSKLEHSPA